MCSDLYCCVTLQQSVRTLSPICYSMLRRLARLSPTATSTLLFVTAVTSASMSSWSDFALQERAPPIFRLLERQHMPTGALSWTLGLVFTNAVQNFKRTEGNSRCKRYDFSSRCLSDLPPISSSQVGAAVVRNALVNSVVYGIVEIIRYESHHSRLDLGSTPNACYTDRAPARRPPINLEAAW